MDLRKFQHNIKVASILLATFIAFSHVTTIDAQSLQLGNCGNSVICYTQSAKDAATSSALFYSAEMMSAYKNCCITEIKLSVESAVAEGTGKVFITHDLNNQAEYEQSFTTIKGGWNVITLDEPYVIDGNELYIGFEVSGQRLQSWCEAFVSNQEWIKNKEGVWEIYNGEYSSPILATVVGENLPMNNVRLSNVQMPEYVLTGTPITYKGEFKNIGAETVTSLTFSYLVNGEEKLSESVSGLNVSPRKAGKFELKDMIFDEEGELDVQLKISKVNEGDDAYINDNFSEIYNTVCRNNFVKRKTLLEMMSTEKCGQCPGAHESIAEELKGLTDVVEIGHHIGFYDDSYTIDESREYEWFYDSYLYAPALMFDRTNFSTAFPKEYNYNLPIINAGGAIAKKVHDEAVKIPAIVSINLSRELNEVDRKLNIHIDGELLLPFKGKGEPRLYLWLTEDSIYTHTQTGATSGFWHRHVARKSVTPAWGAAIDLSSSYSADFKEIEIPESWRLENMHAVAFVALYDPEDRNGCTVLNSEEVKLNGTHNSVQMTDSAKQEKTFDVYTISGCCVLTNATVEKVKQLPKGIYIADNKKIAVY